jgi:ABC-type multidrug transport system ATPase subunit
MTCRRPIRKGDILIAIDTNGSGKSSLIITLIWAIPKTSGRLSAFSDEIEQVFSGLHGCPGLIFQEDSLIDDLTCKDHFKLFCGLLGHTPAKTEEDIASVVSMLKWAEWVDNRAKDLSGGEKRKLCIVLTLVSRQSIVILDEPPATFEGISSLISCLSHEEAESVTTRFPGKPPQSFGPSIVAVITLDFSTRTAIGQR